MHVHRSSHEYLTRKPFQETHGGLEPRYIYKKPMLEKQEWHYDSPTILGSIKMGLRSPTANIKKIIAASYQKMVARTPLHGRITFLFIFLFFFVLLFHPPSGADDGGKNEA